jgi:hypothetical protein
VGFSEQADLVPSALSRLLVEVVIGR